MTVLQLQGGFARIYRRACSIRLGACSGGISLWSGCIPQPVPGGSLEPAVVVVVGCVVVVVDCGSVVVVVGSVVVVVVGCVVVVELGAVVVVDRGSVEVVGDGMVVVVARVVEVVGACDAFGDGGAPDGGESNSFTTGALPTSAANMAGSLPSMPRVQIPTPRAPKLLAI